MLHPWNKLRVQPYIGDRLAVISWEAPDAYNDALYFIARSPSGTEGTWTILNPEAPVTNGLDWFVDENLPCPLEGATYYYKVLARYRSQKITSPAIELFSTVERRDYGIVGQVISEEWMRMRLGGGVRAWHCIPLASGTPAANIDIQTGLLAGAPCGDSYGLPFAGGFGPPIATRIRIMSIGQIKEVDREGGVGTDRTYPVKLRLMAFPRPRRGHMLVCPGDQRFIIGESLNPFFHLGLIPLAWEVDAEMLQPSDDRYRFPVPNHPDDPTDYRV